MLPSLSAFTRKPPNVGHFPQISRALSLHHFCVIWLFGSDVMFAMTVGEPKQTDMYGVIPKRAMVLARLLLMFVSTSGYKS
jgi:hypothetical protein|eukprot:COSAG01_NODE_24976_length_759_cov_19.327273_1_plen_81_part_00